MRKMFFRTIRSLTGRGLQTAWSAPFLGTGKLSVSIRPPRSAIRMQDGGPAQRFVGRPTPNLCESHVGWSCGAVHRTARAARAEEYASLGGKMHACIIFLQACQVVNLSIELPLRGLCMVASGHHSSRASASRNPGRVDGRACQQAARPQVTRGSKRQLLAEDIIPVSLRSACRRNSAPSAGGVASAMRTTP